MTKPELSIQYNRLVGQYGLPHKEGQLNTVNAEEWWERFRTCDTRIFTEAVTRLLGERQYKSFPSVGEMRQHYDALSPAAAKAEDLFRVQQRAVRQAMAQLSVEEKLALEDEVRPMVQDYWNRHAESFRGYFKNLDIPSEALFAEHIKIVCLELFAQRHAMPYDFKSGLLEPKDQGGEVMPVRPVNPIPDPFVNVGGRVGMDVPLANETYFEHDGRKGVVAHDRGGRGREEREDGRILAAHADAIGKEVMPLTSDYPRPVTRGGGRGYEPPARRFQPPPEDEEDIPF